MKFTVTVPPALEPVSLAEAKAHCRITSTDEDGLLAGYVLAARQYVETICGIALITQTIEAYFNCFDIRFLPRWPVQSVSSISYMDVNAVPQVLASTVYYSNLSDRPAYVSLQYSQYWPNVYYRENAVTVTFVAGYGSSPGSIPEPIRQAILMLVGHWYENRETVNVGSVATELPFAVAALLAPFKVYY
jgi:uncharacterized phiE125 gp8 family phage protein